MTRWHRYVCWILLPGLILADAACHPTATQPIPPPAGQPAWCRALPVLGAHNVPIAAPQILPKLASAFDDIRSGRAQPMNENGKSTYRVGELSFVLRAAP
jgi:hypothetical protein